MINYHSVSEIAALLKKRGLNPRRQWGQNFLVSRGAREKIVSIIDPGSEEQVWEIGPGLGSLTELLLPMAGSLVLFELDRGYCSVLRDFFGGHPALTIVEGDFLKTWMKVYREKGVPDVVAGNLPYNAGSVMLGTLVEEGVVPGRCVFTLQKEVVQRIGAAPGSKNYSAFSMVCQYAFSVRVHGTLAPGSFYPEPEVTSAIVELTAHHRYDDPALRPVYLSLVHDLFSSRRKTMKNTLGSGTSGRIYGKDALVRAMEESGINPECRGETVPVYKAVELAKYLCRPA